MKTLDLEAFRATPLVREPFEYLIVPGFVKPEARAAVNQDYPVVPDLGSFPLERLQFGAAFKDMVDDLESEEFRKAFEEKFGIDLTGRPTTITARGRCGTRDGFIHTDSTSKIITVLIYMNNSWEAQGGRLRLLKSGSDLEDMLAEVPPVEGTLVCFRRSNNSWHGHKQFIGERRVIQFNWVTDKSSQKLVALRHTLSIPFKKMMSIVRPQQAKEPVMQHSMRVHDLRNKEFKRILLIKPSAVGDVIHALPVVAKLRQRYPNARIDWMLTPHIADLVGNHPAISNVVLFQRQAYGRPWRDWSKSTGDFARFMVQLREANYDLVLDLHGQFRSAFFALVTGASTRIGFDRSRARVRRAGRDLPDQAFVHGWTGAREGSWIAYTHRIRLTTLDTHASERYLLLGDMLGFPPGPPDFTVPVPSAAHQSVDRVLENNGLSGKELAVLAPGTLWETKHWPAEYFAEVAGYFLKMGWGVVLAGSGKDRAVCQKVSALAPDVVDLSGKTKVSELAALISRAAMCVTNDSGPMHLAAALNAPLVAIFGPTDSIWVGPYGQPDSVLRAGLACSPCYLRRIKDCPFGHACMKQVTPALVIQRIERLLL